MAEILRLSDRPSSLDDAWRAAELFGQISVDHPCLSDSYRVKIYGKTSGGSSMWAEGKGHDILTAICNAVEEAHNHGLNPR